MNLIRMNRRVKYLLGSMKGAVNDHYMIDILIGDCSIYPTTYSKKFSFSCSDVDSSMQCFDNRFIVGMNV